MTDPCEVFCLKDNELELQMSKSFDGVPVLLEKCIHLSL